MTGIRRYKKDFTVIGNDCFRDTNLSAESLGVICYLRSKPHDWRVMPTELAGRFSCGRDRIQRIIGELVEAGYLRKVRSRDPVTKAWQPVEYIILDLASEPLPENTVVASDEPPPENLPMGEPSLANPSTANPALLNTDSTKDGKTPTTDSSPALARRAAEQFFDQQFWPAYPKRGGGNPKEPAKKKIVALILKGENPAKILTGVNDLYAALEKAGKIGTEFVPMALTWINRRQWNDDPVDMAATNGAAPTSFFEIAAGKW